MKKMTQKQAWAYTAELWANAKIGEHGTGKRLPIVSIEGCSWKYAGICGVINELFSLGVISERIHAIMKAKIPKPKYAWGRNDPVWAFPLDMKGAKQRAAFCLLQARLLSK